MHDSKYTAYIIAAIGYRVVKSNIAINHDICFSSIFDPMTKICTLLDKHGIPMGGQQ